VEGGGGGGVFFFKINLIEAYRWEFFLEIIMGPLTFPNIAVDICNPAVGLRCSLQNRKKNLSLYLKALEKTLNKTHL
jgi:hypothetical protein